MSQSVLIIKIYALTCKPSGNFCKVTNHTSQMLYRDHFISYPIEMQMPRGTEVHVKPQI